MDYPKGTVVAFSSMGISYNGFIIGTCSYDNAGSDNAYVIRYIAAADGDQPRKPYTIVDKTRVSPVLEYQEAFLVAGHWSATPDDRCDEWEIKTTSDGWLKVEGVHEARQKADRVIDEIYDDGAKGPSND